MVFGLFYPFSIANVIITRMKSGEGGPFKEEQVWSNCGGRGGGGVVLRHMSS